MQEKKGGRERKRVSEIEERRSIINTPIFRGKVMVLEWGRVLRDLG